MSNLKIFSIRKGEVSKEKEYSQFLDRCQKSVIQQTIEWRNTIADLSSDESIFLLAKKENEPVGALPCYIYHSSLGNIITSIPHAGPLGGVACSMKKEEEKREVYRILLDEMIKTGKETACVLATVITSPFVNDLKIYKKSLSFDYLRENFTQYVDLTKPFNFSHGIRNDVNKGQRLGLKVRELKNLSEVNSWYKIHRKRMGELQTTSLPRKLFLNAFDFLVPKKGRFFAIEYQGKIIGGCLYIFHRDIIDVYMLSSDSRFRQLSPGTFLTDYVIRWAKENGFRYFNFQSSKKRGDGVYKFKAQFGAIDTSYYFLTKKIGDITKILATPLEEIKEKYRWHYVLPYNLWDKKEKK